ncbi:MAG TPA: hypothetical protein VJM50_17435 [Pyrinomonadaceae bacterium]|nr:hypothetical protein [Pyrinomonadaceae bacterium]
MQDNIQIYVDPHGHNDNNNSANEANPVQTADKAFSLLPPSWRGSAEIIFAPGEYTIETDAVSFGMPIGAGATPLVIRGAYTDLFTITAEAGSNNNTIVATRDVAADELIGAVLTRISGADSQAGPAVSIRGNTAGPRVQISLQQPIARVEAGNTFVVQRPAVTLKPRRTLNLTSHDGRSPNLSMIGIKFEPAEGAGLNLLNVRAHCDTCEFSLRKLPSSESAPILFVHTNARINGGLELTDLSPDLPSRKQAGVYIHSNNPQTVVWATRAGILGGHLTFRGITVRVSQGGVLAPHSLEALSAPIHILTGGSALAQRNSDTGQTGWGTADNKARIRNVAGDGLRVFNGGTVNSALGPIHLDISGCTGDGIRVDMGSTASFGPPGGKAGLVTKGANNGRFGMNVRNASRALIGSDAAENPLQRLKGGEGDGLGDVTLDDERAHTWRNVIDGPLSNPGMSLVRVNK